MKYLKPLSLDSRKLPSFTPRISARLGRHPRPDPAAAGGRGGAGGRDPARGAGEPGGLESGGVDLNELRGGAVLFLLPFFVLVCVCVLFVLFSSPSFTVGCVGFVSNKGSQNGAGVPVVCWKPPQQV